MLACIVECKGREGMGAEQRTHTALVRLTEAEWAAWVRAVTAGAIEGGAGAPSRDDEGARALAGQVARIGSNLNQLARALHVAERGGPEVPGDQVAAELAAVRAELRALREAQS